MDEGALGGAWVRRLCGTGQRRDGAASSGGLPWAPLGVVAWLAYASSGLGPGSGEAGLTGGRPEELSGTLGSLRRLSSSALVATMRLEPDMVSAAISGRRTNPKAGSKTPAAMGSAIALYPMAQPRFWRILRTVERPIRNAAAT